MGGGYNLMVAKPGETQNLIDLGETKSKNAFSDKKACYKTRRRLSLV